MVGFTCNIAYTRYVRCKRASVWQDLEENRVLGALLHGDYGDESRSAAEEVKDKCAPVPSHSCVAVFPVRQSAIRPH